MTDADQQVVLITGAGSGIGRATAFKFAAAGAAICLLDRETDALRSVADEIADRGGKAIVSVTDVTQSNSVESAVENTVRTFGRLNCAVAAAGIATVGNVLQATEEDWRRTLDVNLTGAFLTAKHAMPHLIAAGSSSFVGVSSDAGIRGSSGFMAYAAAKHGLVGLIRCLALDFGPQGVRSNVVCPGFVETPMTERLLAENATYSQTFYESRIPLGRFAQPSEVADAIAHLASREARYVNGMVYVIDGGTTAGTFG